MSEQVASYGQAQSFTYLAAKAEFPGLKIMSHDDFGSLKLWAVPVKMEKHAQTLQLLSCL